MMNEYVFMTMDEMDREIQHSKLSMDIKVYKEIQERYFNLLYKLAEPHKWIPHNFLYCDDCPFRDYNPLYNNQTDICQNDQMNGYCHYLKQGDWEEGGTSLLWDGIKECGINDDDIKHISDDLDNLDKY